MSRMTVVRLVLLASVSLLAACSSAEPEPATKQVSDERAAVPARKDSYAKLDRRTEQLLEHLNIASESAIQILVEPGSKSEADLYHARTTPHEESTTTGVA